MLAEKNLEIREATTRYMNITCKDRQTGNDFDFTGYTVQTYLAFGNNQRYVPTTVVENLVSYEIPADISLGVENGVAETRIFKNGDVYEILRVNVKVRDAKKPDIEPLEVTP